MITLYPGGNEFYVGNINTSKLSQTKYIILQNNCLTIKSGWEYNITYNTDTGKLFFYVKNK